MNKLFLFDIDGTLISPGPSARRAISQAIEDYTGIPPNLQIKDVAGLTDKLIIKNAIKKSGKNWDSDAVINIIINNYLELFSKLYNNTNGAFLYTDSIKLIEKVKTQNIPIGLLTGNMRRGAEIKLGKFDIMKHFPFGVFADDGDTRNDLPNVAKEIAQKLYNKQFDFQNIVLVGDTPEDAIAAKLNGCRSIVVCRRNEWYEEIVQAGADLVVDSLDDPQIEKNFLL
jgi:phosphoglycolate phosphatase-like HAD superfamily hydrolase